MFRPYMAIIRFYVKISLYKLCELRYDVEISPSNYCRNVYLSIGGYSARLICSVTPVVQGVSSWGVQSVVMGCLTGCQPPFLLGVCCCEAVYG